LLFEQVALAFGASASVLAFNWVAAALLELVVRLLMTCATNVYDDFTFVEVEQLTKSTDSCVSSLFGLLGWDLKPLPPFAPCSEPLGSILDLSSSSRGSAFIKNKESRVREITSIIQDAFANQQLSFTDMRVLRGRLVHARAQTFGRFGGAALAELGRIAESSPKNAVLPRSCLVALERLVRYLSLAPPRVLHAKHSAPVLVFVDGSADPDPSSPSGFQSQHWLLFARSVVSCLLVVRRFDSSRRAL